MEDSECADGLTCHHDIVTNAWFCSEMDEEPTHGKSVGEACMTTDECADSLICKDVMHLNGYTELLCAEMDEEPACVNLDVGTGLTNSYD